MRVATNFARRRKSHPDLTFSTMTARRSVQCISDPMMLLSPSRGELLTATSRRHRCRRQGRAQAIHGFDRQAEGAALSFDHAQRVVTVRQLPADFPQGYTRAPDGGLGRWGTFRRPGSVVW